MVNMLRKTKDGGYERQDAQGVWVPVPEGEAMAAVAVSSVAPEPEVDEADVGQMIDSLVDELNGANGTAETPSQDYTTQDAADGRSIEDLKPEAVIDTEPASAPGDFDLEVPGLVSGDGSRGSRAFQTVKERLKANARKRREPRKVEVGSSAARVTGPARVEGTERRQAVRARERLEAGKGSDGVVKQRYVQRAAPSLFDGRPRWVADLFEAHFRSELTLGMRRAYGRMKISRQDYAIGWLTAFDKFREESSLLRLKDKNGSAE